MRAARSHQLPITARADYGIGDEIGAAEVLQRLVIRPALAEEPPDRRMLLESPNISPIALRAALKYHSARGSSLDMAETVYRKRIGTSRLAPVSQ